jgi:lipoate-protein ligase A
MVNRLIIDEPGRGTWNMAVDEALFQSGAVDSSVLRLYQWSEPTLSLGYFQRAADRVAHAASRTLPIVRRSTGGGAIVHDRELTYSLITQLIDERPSRPRQLMAKVHESLVDLLKEMGINGQICGRSEVEAGTAEPFLCFLRHTAGDILIGSHKVVGSAQRRHRRILLQHGSILLGRSAGAPELSGISEISRSNLAACSLIEAWPKRLEAIFSAPWKSSGLSSNEYHLAEKIEAERFDNDRWNLKR